MEEIVFEILAEGGSLGITRRKTEMGDRFLYNHNEMDMSDEGREIDHTFGFTSFEEPFQIINSKYPWYSLHLETLHEDFRKYVLHELVSTLNRKNLTPQVLSHSREDLEKQLKAKLIYAFAPIKNGLQIITATSMIKGKELIYQEYTKESGLKARLKGSMETWLLESLPIYGGNDLLNNFLEIKEIGILEVSGNTIIIKNEHGQILYAFSSDKFFVSTEPILSSKKSWWFREIK